MNPYLKQYKYLSLALLLSLVFMQAGAQVRSRNVKQVKTPPPASAQLAAFKHLADEASINLNLPKEFREIPALNNEDFTFDYALDLPKKGFEVWYHVRSQKENWASFERLPADQRSERSNPDSVYKDIGKAHASMFTGEANVFTKVLPPEILKRYNADAGRSYMLTLLDQPETKRYQYALLIVLQKYHTGTALMVCFTNQKGPEFYRNAERAGSVLKFKPVAQNVDKLAD